MRSAPTQQRLPRTLPVAVLVLALLALGTFGPNTRWGAAAVDPVTISPAVYPTDGFARVSSPTFGSPSVPVNDAVTIGATLYVGGAFTSVYDRDTGRYRGNPFLGAIDTRTGQWVDWFRPRLDGAVHSLAVTPDGRLLVGGEFTSVNGHAATEGLVKLHPATGMIEPGFASSIVRADAPAPAIVREIRIAGRWAYVAGLFSRITGGVNTRVSAAYHHVARVDWRTGEPDTSWVPDVRGRGAWAVAPLSDNSRVFIGGFWDSVGGVAGTARMAALDGTTARPNTSWRATPVGSGVWGMAVFKDRLYVSYPSPERRWEAKSISTGAVLSTGRTSSGAQRVEAFGDYVYIGCHCTESNYFFTKIDGATGTRLEHITAHLRGGDGGWAIAEAPDRCLWMGGHFARATVTTTGGESRVDNLARVCPVGGPRATNAQPVAPAAFSEQAPPTRPPSLSGALDATRTRMVLNWVASTDDSGVVSYRLYRDGFVVAETRATSFRDAAVSGNHTWAVVAYDGAGRASASRVWRLGAGASGEAAPSIAGLTGTTEGGRPVLTWAGRPNPDLGYIVRRDGVEVARLVGLPSEQVELANAGNTRLRSGASSAGLFDTSRWNATPTSTELTVDLGESIRVDRIHFRDVARATFSAYLSDRPFTTWDPRVLEADPNVSTYRLSGGDGGGVISAVSPQIRARYIRVVSNWATAKSFIVSTRVPTTRRFVDTRASAGQHRYEVLAYRPGDTLGAPAAVTATAR